jgi:hypothetical protein
VIYLIIAQLGFDLTIYGKFVNAAVLTGVAGLTALVIQMLKMNWPPKWPKLENGRTLACVSIVSVLFTLLTYAALWQGGDLPIPKWCVGVLSILVTAVLASALAAGADNYKDLLKALLIRVK